MAPAREDFGSWLEGTPDQSGRGRGSSLGLPSQGAGSLAGLGRRVAALLVDWMLSMAVAALFWRDPGGVWIFAADPIATLAVFAGTTAVFVAFLGHTLGHLLLGLQVVRITRDSRGSRRAVAGAPGLLSGAVRAGLVCLVIPAVVWDRDGRGLHDVAASTAIVRR